MSAEKIQTLLDALKAYDMQPEVVEYNLLEKQDMLLDYSRHSPELQEQIDNLLELCDEVLVRDSGHPDYHNQVQLLKKAREQDYAISFASGEDDCVILTTPVTMVVYDAYLS